MTFQLSPSQQQVVDHRGGHLQVIACAGSGKTESISRRVAALIAEGEPPESIIAFTFTEKAAAELKDRIYRRVEEVKGKDFLGQLGPMYVGTIHGYCFSMLQEQIPSYGNFDVIDPHRHVALLQREAKRLNLKRFKGGLYNSIAAFSQTVDIIGNELIESDQLPDDLRETYTAYLDTLDRYHLLTFSLIIQKAVQELEKPEVFERIHGPLRHLIVDEFQDINPAQERLIRLLGTDPVQVAVVGDDDQAIYQWRGSVTDHIIHFTEQWPNVTQVELGTNRRSVPIIVQQANDFAQTIAPRLAKSMHASRDHQGPEMVPWSAKNAEDEAEKIAEQIARLHEHGFKYRDMAILFRSVRSSCGPLLEALEDRGIPANCGGRTGLFLQLEARLLGRTYAWLVDNEWRDARFGGDSEEVDLSSLLSEYETLFGNSDPIPGLKAFLQDWKRNTSDTRRSVDLVGEYYRLLRLLGVHQWDLNNPYHTNRSGMLARFSNLLADYENATRRSRSLRKEDGTEKVTAGTDRGIWYYRNLASYIQHYAKDAYEDFEGESFEEVDAVSVLTIHQAKGLEWPVVFLPSLTSRRFPSSKSGQQREWLLPEDIFPEETQSRYQGGDTEERRLFYVALTRARDCIYLSWFRQIKQEQKPSPYLIDLFGDNPPEGPQVLPLPDAPAAGAGADAAASQVSFSELALYENCPYQYRLANSLGFQNTLVAELGYGNAVHHVLRLMAEHALTTGNPPSADETQSMLEAGFYLPFANKPAHDNMLKAATGLVRRYCEDWSSDLDSVWATERPFEIHTDDGILVGRADLILTQDSGNPESLAIVDYKTSTDDDRDPTFSFQLAVYAAAGRGEGLEVKAGFLHNLKAGMREEKDVSSEAAEAALDKAKSLIQNIRQAKFPARPEAQKCKHCDYRRLCSQAGCHPLELL
jgi:DNA helicase II / ATP-dependent DNA helicase PcrA